MNQRIVIEGMMPSRALNRLRREGICLKNVRKSKKNQIVVTVDAKDVEKVFAIYPNMCYNGGRYTAYTAHIMPTFGMQKWWNEAKKRTGLWLGGVLFLLITVLSDRLVLGIQVIGEPSYTSEVTEILTRNGVEYFRPYSPESADMITAEILRLGGVGFCSIRKVGSTLIVEVYTAPFSEK